MARVSAKMLTIGAILVGGTYGSLIYCDLRVGSFDATAARLVSDPTLSIAPQDAKAWELASEDVITVVLTSVDERVRVSGELKPVRRVTLRAKTAGTVMDVTVRPGEQVKAGDVLVRFDVEELAASLAQESSTLDGARAELLRAEQTLGRVSQLFQKNISSADQIEKARGDVLTAQAKMRALAAQTDIAKVALRNAEVRALFDGVVANRAVEPGTTLASNVELMTVIDTSLLEAEVLVSTRDIFRLKVGQTADLRIDGQEGGPIVGTVNRINPAANDGSRFVSVYVGLENAEGRLWGGMFASGSILIREQKDALVLPATALREDRDGSFVLALEQGQLVRKAVSVRSRWNSGADVEVDGVTVGDVIVAMPLTRLKPGTAALIAQAD